MQRVEKAIENVIGYFTKEDIRNVCPDIGESTINRVFERLKAEEKLSLWEKEEALSGGKCRYKKLSIVKKLNSALTKSSYNHIINV